MRAGLEASWARGHAVRRERAERGLSVAEVLLTLALLSLLIAVWVPESLRKSISANEAVAIGGLKAIAGANAAYFSLSEPHQYASALEELGAGDSAFLDRALSSGVKSGYAFTFGGSTQAEGLAGFTAEAHPTVYRRAGLRSFFIDETGLLRGEDIGGFPGHGGMPAWSDPVPQEEGSP